MAFHKHSQSNTAALHHKEALVPLAISGGVMSLAFYCQQMFQPVWETFLQYLTN